MGLSKMKLGEMRLGEMRLGEMRLGEMRLGEMLPNQNKILWIPKNQYVSLSPKQDRGRITSYSKLLWSHV